MDKAVFVFLDWQNVYMRARECFHDSQYRLPHHMGQVDPVDLALVLTKRHADMHPDEKFALTQVRIYRGIPLQQHDEKGYAAARRQHSAWTKDSRVQLHTSDLRYPRDYGQPGCQSKPREKGIDVKLALDVVTTGLDKLYDVGIVMSADSDLAPALELMHQRSISRGGPVTEVAAWRSSTFGSRISFGKNRPHCHWLEQQDYWGLRDERDYSLPTEKKVRSGPPRPGDWLTRR